MMRVLLVELLGAVVGVVSLFGAVVLDLHERVEDAGAGGLKQSGLKHCVVDDAGISRCGQINIGRPWRFKRHCISPLVSKASIRRVARERSIQIMFVIDSYRA